MKEPYCIDCGCYDPPDTYQDTSWKEAAPICKPCGDKRVTIDDPDNGDYLESLHQDYGGDAK